MNERNIDQVLDSMFTLYETHGYADYIGEPVSQLEHMSQAAAMAKAEGYDDEVILAAFFHDIGNLLSNIPEDEKMDMFGNADHERIGAEYLLKMGFSDKIAKLVQSHVAAKRYLTYKDPEYYHQLSAASKATLEFQGGRMTEGEAFKFESDKDCKLMIKMRNWDELAKQEHVAVDNVQEIRKIAKRHLLNRIDPYKI